MVQLDFDSIRLKITDIQDEQLPELNPQGACIKEPAVSRQVGRSTMLHDEMHQNMQEALKNATHMPKKCMRCGLLGCTETQETTG